MGEIEQLAAIGFLPVEIAISMEFPVRDFLELLGLDLEQIDSKFFCLNPAQKAIKRGQLRQLASVRKSVFEQAKAGSSPAQTMALAILQEVKIKASL